jgi:hypothetical protein
MKSRRRDRNRKILTRSRISMAMGVPDTYSAFVAETILDESAGLDATIETARTQSAGFTFARE